MTLSEAERAELIERATQIRKNCYATYSGYEVGASLVTACGKFFDGVNVENASFGLTICAERSAIFAAVSAGHREFKAMAIASIGCHAPCGACRQVIAEFNGKLPVFLVDPQTPDLVDEATLSELLPRQFEFPKKNL